MSSNTISLATFEVILLASEKEYRSSKGDEREKVLDEVMESITSNEQYKFKGTMQDLKKVSLD